MATVGGREAGREEVREGREAEGRNAECNDRGAYAQEKRKRIAYIPGTGCIPEAEVTRVLDTIQARLKIKF